jgi:hypothetical protein
LVALYIWTVVVVTLYIRSKNMKKRNLNPKAVEERRAWARAQLRANPRMNVYAGANNLLEQMHKKFGTAIDTNALSQIKREVLGEAAKPKVSRPMAYLGRQLEVIAKQLRERLPDVTRLVMTADGDKIAVEYTLREVTEVSGKVKL